MQQFTVPQFIDTEDKILGPLTVRQFIIMMICFVTMAIFYKIFDFTLFVVASFIWIILCGVLAFVKINAQPFHLFILNFVQTAKRPRLRIWNNQGKAALIEEEPEAIDTSDYIARPPQEVSSSRLTDLALIVDTAGTYKDNSKIKNQKSK